MKSGITLFTALWLAAVSLHGFSDDRAQGLQLIQAAKNGDTDQVRRLAKEGVDIDFDGIQQITPLMWTVAYGKKNVKKTVKLLLELGADVNARDGIGRTALHMACASDKPWSRPWSKGIVKALIRGGADVNAVDGNGDTPLFFAMRGEKDWAWKIGEILVEAGGKVNLQDKAGDTPLHVAARNAYDAKRMMKMLVKAGANPEIKNNKGETARALAKAAGCDSVE